MLSETLYLIIDMEILKEAFFFCSCYLYEVRRSEMKEEGKGQKAEE
jgi:hypothetical protein